MLDEDSDSILPGAENGRGKIDRCARVSGQHIGDGVVVRNVRAADRIRVHANVLRDADGAAMQGTPAAGELSHLGAVYGKSTCFVRRNGTEVANHPPASSGIAPD